MKDVAELTVAQVRIYRSDSLPFIHLRLDASIDLLKEAFGFKRVQSETMPMIFEEGVFQFQEKAIVIHSLAIEQRKTVLKVFGSSDAANAINARFVTLMSTIGPEAKKRRYDPVAETQETTCVATLEFSFEELLSRPLVRFLREPVLKNLQTDFAMPASIGLRRLSFEVRFEASNPDLVEHGVELSPKLLTIEPRVGTPLRERRFFISSPTGSATHFKLVETLENELSVAANGRKVKGRP